MNLITHKDLVNRANKWVSQKYPIVLSEFKSYAVAIPDVIGFTHHNSVVVECKISRADFLHDQHKTHRHYTHQLGNYRWYMVLPHILCPEDIPDGWGLLYVESNRIVKVKNAPLHSEPEIRVAEYSLLYSMVLRIKGNGLMDKALQPYGSLAKFNNKNKVLEQNLSEG